MSITRLAPLLAALIFPVAAAAQQAAMPPGLVARATALNSQCRAAGGQVANADRGFVHNLDLTGDGKAEIIMDEAGFACSARQVTAITPDGAPLEVFDGVTGQSLYRGLAYTFALQPGAARNTLIVTLRGRVCSPNALASTTCQRPLTWNAQTRAFTGAPTLAAAPSAPPAVASRDPLAAGPAPKAGAPAAPTAAPAAGGGMTLTEADKAAAFRAAGFKQTRRGWERCEDPGSLSYSPGAIEEIVDLNNDGRPEAVVTEGGAGCFGNTGGSLTIMSKTAGGGWIKVMDEVGIFSPLTTRVNGWLEVRVGGPGFQHPVFRFDGKQYVRNRIVRE